MKFSEKAAIDESLRANLFSVIVNESVDVEGNNYLIHLINQLTKTNRDEITKMIKFMLSIGCSLNMRNLNSESAFSVLVSKHDEFKELVHFCIENFYIDIDFKHEKALDNEINQKLEEKEKIDKNLSFCLQNLREIQVEEVLKTLFPESNEFIDDIGLLLEAAVAKNLPDMCKSFIKHGADCNRIPMNSQYNSPPAFLACTFGNFKVLEILLEFDNLEFFCVSSEINLLHQIFKSNFISFEDRQAMFDLLIMDRRCNLEIINQVDTDGNSPLFYATENNDREIIKELIMHGAYIGHEAVINNIDKELFQEILDENIKCSGNVNDKNCEIFIDHRFLIPPVEDDSRSLETTAVNLVAKISNLREFILHPVISSYLLLKWRKIDFIVYFNLLIYFSFLLYMGFFIVNFYNVSNTYEPDDEYCRVMRAEHEILMMDPDIQNLEKIEEKIESKDEKIKYWDKFCRDALISSLSSRFDEAEDTNKLFGREQEFLTDKKFHDFDKMRKEEQWKSRTRQHFTSYRLSFWFCMCGLFLMAVRETAQLMASWKKYFFKFSNWLDIALISLSFYILIQNVDVGYKKFKQICAVMIILMAGQSITSISKVSAFSLSLHMAILARVMKTFIKTIAPYLIIIIAFGMSFYSFNYNDDYVGDHGSTSSESKTVREEDDENGFAQPFISVISTVRMMLSDFDVLKFDKDDHFQGILFLLFMVFISTVLFNLLNALAISDTNEIMKVAEFVVIRKRLATIHSYERLFSFLQIPYLENKTPSIVLTPNKNFLVQVQQSGKGFKNKKMQKYQNLNVENILFWRGKFIEYSKAFKSEVLDYLKDRMNEEKDDKFYREFEEFKKSTQLALLNIQTFSRKEVQERRQRNLSK